jgi:hypothetical protein
MFRAAFAAVAVAATLLTSADLSPLRALPPLPRSGHFREATTLWRGGRCLPAAFETVGGQAGAKCLNQ